MKETTATPKQPASDPVLRVSPLGFVWGTQDPFLFCVHHDDHYPAGNERFGPATSLVGRDLGMDFEVRDGFRMYHGHVVPGFPRHPHRGFETVTVVRRGLLDHADSLGAGARYGGGDVQWLTAGAGIQHAEMFPLLRKDAPNPVELFQIWLNLPGSSKFVEPHFSMLWREQIQTARVADAAGRESRVTVIAGTFGGVQAPPPPPSSWASRPDSDVAIWTLELSPAAELTLPPAREGTGRTVYVFEGEGVAIGDRSIPPGSRVDVLPNQELKIANGASRSEALVLQGRPIGEPVVQHGPFVMNSADEIRAAFADYQRTQFGGWPWDSADPVHGPADERFARHPDGHEERPG